MEDCELIHFSLEERGKDQQSHQYACRVLYNGVFSPGGQIGHRPARRVSHQPRVFRIDSAGVARSRRGPFSEPRTQFIRSDFNVQPALVDVDGDNVAILHGGDRAALRCLGHDVADYEATSGAGEAPESVINATVSPRPEPCSAPVTSCISRIPGPPFGPS